MPAAIPGFPGLSDAEITRMRLEFGDRLLGGGVDRGGSKFVEVVSNRGPNIGDPQKVYLTDIDKGDPDKGPGWPLGHMANVSTFVRGGPKPPVPNEGGWSHD